MHDNAAKKGVPDEVPTPRLEATVHRLLPKDCLCGARASRQEVCHQCGMMAWCPDCNGCTLCRFEAWVYQQPVKPVNPESKESLATLLTTWRLLASLASRYRQSNNPQAERLAGLVPAEPLREAVRLLFQRAGRPAQAADLPR